MHVRSFRLPCGFPKLCVKTSNIYSIVRTGRHPLFLLRMWCSKYFTTLSGVDPGVDSGVSLHTKWHMHRLHSLHANVNPWLIFSCLACGKYTAVRILPHSSAEWWRCSGMWYYIMLADHRFPLSPQALARETLHGLEEQTRTYKTQYRATVRWGVFC